MRPDVYTYRMCHIFTQGSTRGRVYFFTQGSCIFWLIKQLPNSERIGALSRPGRPVFSRARRDRGRDCSRLASFRGL